MFRFLLGFLIFVLVTIVFMAIQFSMPVVLFGGEHHYEEPGLELLFPPVLSFLFTVILLRCWRMRDCFNILFFTGLILICIAAAYIVAEWPRINNPVYYDLLQWPTQRNFVVFERFLTIFLIEYTGIAFLGTALLHDLFKKNMSNGKGIASSEASKAIRC